MAPLQREVEHDDDRREHREIEQVEQQRIARQRGKRSWNEADAEWPARDRFGVERNELHGDGDTKSGDGQIVGA